MGALFLLILWTITLAIAAIFLGVFACPLGLLGNKTNRKRKMLLAFLTPGVAIGTYATCSLICMTLISIILNIDIGFGDSWSSKLKYDYEVASTDYPENGGIYHNHETILTDVSHLQEINDSVIGKSCGHYFILNLRTGKLEDELTLRQFEPKIHNHHIALMPMADYYWAKRKDWYILAGILCLIATIVAVRLLWKLK